MDARAVEELSKRVHSSNRASRGVVLLHVLLFCSAIILNLWALIRLRTCSPQALLSWDGRHQTSASVNCQQSVSLPSVTRYLCAYVAERSLGTASDE